MQDPDHTHGLEELSGAKRYRQYIFDLLRPHLGHSVLEVGAGRGELADLLADGTRDVIVTDIDPSVLAHLTAHFHGRPRVSVTALDLSGSASDIEQVDCAIAVNVMEHIDDDVLALAGIAERVKPGGTIALFVPAFPSLYGEFDRAVGHVRRYTPATMRAAVEGAGLEVQVLRPVDLLGAIAWWLAVKIGGQTRPRRSLVALFDVVAVPITRVIDRLFRLRFGKSILCVARVPIDQSNGK